MRRIFLVFYSKGGRNLGKFDTKNAERAGSTVRTAPQKIFIKVRGKNFTTSEKRGKTKEKKEEARGDFARAWARGKADNIGDYCTDLYCDFSGWN